MPPDSEPLIKPEPGGRALVLSYNVPEPTSYTGRHVIELDLPSGYFSPAATRTGDNPAVPPPRDVVVGSLVTGGVSDRLAAPAPESTGGTAIALRGTTATEAAARLAMGYRAVRYVDVAGDMAYRIMPPAPRDPRPRLLLVEVYRLSSYLGAYGAGRVLKTLSLLPGEKTKISVKTYTKTEAQQKAASSILDSFTKESADDFERSLLQEQSDKRNEQENFEYHAEAEASASWGFGSAKVSGGVKGGTASAREEFAKNVSNATQKHSAKASAKREVQVNTSYEVKEETGEEMSIERQIENVNLSRTLNFVFRQMNQEFVTILHLVDVRIAFFNGFTSSAREVALPQLDSLLEELVVEDKRAEVKGDILNQIQRVWDYRDEPRDFIEEVDRGGDEYLRVKRDLSFTYHDPQSDADFTVAGVPLAVNTYTMRTEGVIVEALLGEADALDAYARELQTLEVKRRKAETDRLVAEAERAELINKIATQKDADAAKVLSELTCPCAPPTGPNGT